MEKLTRYDFYALPDSHKLKTMVKENWVHLTESVEIMYGVSKDGAYTRKSLGYGGVKLVMGRIYIDMNNYSVRDTDYTDMNIKRLYVVDRMFESVYWNLDIFLNDFQKSKLLAALTGDSVASWMQYIFNFNPTLGTKSTKLTNFIKYGLGILKTKALYENFEKRW